MLSKSIIFFILLISTSLTIPETSSAQIPTMTPQQRQNFAGTYQAIHNGMSYFLFIKKVRTYLNNDTFMITGFYQLKSDQYLKSLYDLISEDIFTIKNQYCKTFKFEEEIQTYLNNDEFYQSESDQYFQNSNGLISEDIFMIKNQNCKIVKSKEETQTYLNNDEFYQSESDQYFQNSNGLISENIYMIRNQNCKIVKSKEERCMVNGNSNIENAKSCSKKQLMNPANDIFTYNSNSSKMLFTLYQLDSKDGDSLQDLEEDFSLPNKEYYISKISITDHGELSHILFEETNTIQFFKSKTLNFQKISNSYHPILANLSSRYTKADRNIHNRIYHKIKESICKALVSIDKPTQKKR